jgi:hypothetical protein
MTAPAVKVELVFDLGTRDPNSFVLNSATKGVLNNTSFTLGGARFFDITQRMLNVSTKRGKSQALDRNNAGLGSLEVDNTDRLFDPLYEAGPYFGQLVPRKEIRISSNERPVLRGYIDDFDIIYQPGERSRVRIDFSDAFSTLSNSELADITPASELSGARINRILNRPEVNWPAELRNVDAGDTTVLDTSITEGTNTLGYLQLVESSEFGNVFIARDGKFTFKERNSVPNSTSVLFTDGELEPGLTPIIFADVNIVYGSENLYNRIVLQNADAIPDEAIAQDSASQLEYGVRTYTQTGLLIQDTTQLQFLADFLLARFKQPLYRFESVSVVLDNQTLEKQNEVLNLEIGDVVKVKFTPSNVPPAIEQNCRVIGISHEWTNTRKTINIALERIDFGLFILDNAIFGVLNQDSLTY